MKRIAAALGLCLLILLGFPSATPLLAQQCPQGYTLSGGRCVAGAAPFTLTTTGSSGAATFASGTLNIPQYSGGTGGAYTSVSFSATPTFTASATVSGFSMTLTGNVTSSTAAGASAGQVLAFNICQDGTGGRSFVWPTAFVGAAAISGTLSSCTHQAFEYDGTNYQSVAGAYITGGTPGVDIPGSSSGLVTLQAPAVATGTMIVSPNQNIRRVAYVFDGGGTALSGTLDACQIVDFAGTISGVTLLADTAGTATVDVKTVVYGSYTGAASASSIAAAAIPAISSAIKYQDTTLTGWTTALAANTAVCFHVTSPATSTWIMADLKVTAN